MYCQSVRHGFMRISLFSHSSFTKSSPSRGGSVLNKMPKKEKTCKNSQTTTKQSETASPVSNLKDGAIAISVHAKPGAKENAITDVSSEAVGVAIAAPPTDGEANAELVRYLCKVLAVKKSDVMLDKGSKSRDKIIKVTASISKEEVLDRLQQEAAE